MAYRNDLDALAARHDALAADVADRTRELDAAARLLAEARARARIENLAIAAPCGASWANMSGDDRVRSCADCDQHVYNISAMTRDEAEALIVEREGRLCVRYFQRADGTILMRDCAVGVKRRRRRRWIIAGATVTIVGTILAARGRHQTSDSATILINPNDGPEMTTASTTHESAVPRPPPHAHQSPMVPDHPHVAPVARDDDDKWIMGRR